MTFFSDDLAWCVAAFSVADAAAAMATIDGRVGEKKCCKKEAIGSAI